MQATDEEAAAATATHQALNLMLSVQLLAFIEVLKHHEEMADTYYQRFHPGLEEAVLLRESRELQQRVMRFVEQLGVAVA